MTTQENLLSKITISVFLFCMLFPLLSIAQTSVSAELSKTNIVANETVELTFSLDEAEDFYYFSVEILFDPAIFEFVGVEKTGLTSNGLIIADLIEPGRLGASVTLTEEMESEDQGVFMKLTFSAQSKASVGAGAFEYEYQELGDSDGATIETIPVEDSDYSINESIGVVQLTMNQSATVTEGDEFDATGRIYAADISDDSENESRIRTWIGVSDEDTDPATWSESNWHLMDFVENSENYFIYSKEIAFMRPVGIWYVALRSDLDQDEDYRFGGTGGLWDDDSAILTIEKNPPFRYTIAGWDFDDETITASQAVPANEEAEIGISGGATLDGYSAGATGRAKNSRDWDGYPEEENYWQIVISTKNFEELILSSKQSGSNTGPRDFILQTSVDGETWYDVPGGEIEVGTNWTSGVVNELALPEELNDLDEAYIRWFQKSDTRINGDEGVGNTGTNRIDDIKITGVNTNVQSVNVWPGDTNNDGVVDEADLLPIGQNWLREGPRPVYGSIAWEKRVVEGWIPNEATFADASGSGRVDQNDLQPIGLNFGKGNGTEKSKDDRFDVIASHEMSQMDSGESIDLYLITPEKTVLTGISFRIQIEGIAPEGWSVESVEPLDWGESWAEDDRLIQFKTERDNYMAAAMVHKGAIDPVQSDRLVRVTIRANETWSGPVTAEILRVKVASGTDSYSLTEVQLTDDPNADPIIPGTGPPERTELLVNYPNPFNPTTVIPFTLSEAGDVRVEIFDAIGRRVASIFREDQQPGEYTINFDGSSLSSGVYMYRLQVNNIQQVRMMTLVK